VKQARTIQGFPGRNIATAALSFLALENLARSGRDLALPVPDKSSFR
jgi:hypothetical protein